MRSRLHSTLVYFGLIEDKALAAEQEERPMNAWQYMAVTVLFCLIAGIIVGVLWLVGVDLSLYMLWRWFLFACFVVFIIDLSERVRARWRGRKARRR